MKITRLNKLKFLSVQFNLVYESAITSENDRFPYSSVRLKIFSGITTLPYI